MDKLVKKIPVIIPARGGSKGLPGKNIKILAGKPLIAWTIEAALKSKYVSNVVVTTDSEEIANISKKYGAWVPFLRPTDLAAADSLAIDTYLFIVKKLNSEYNKQINEFVVLQPTSPLRKTEHINESIELFYNRNADSVISLVEASHPPYWYKTIDENNKIKNLFTDSNYSINRQQLPKSYLPNGAILVLKYDLLQESRSYYSKNSVAYLMSQEESIDIDNFIDFKVCEMILTQNQKKNK